MILTQLTDKQLAVWEAMKTHRLVIADGSVRSGKSVGADIAWLDFIRNAPPGNLMMLGKTERTLKRNVIDPFIELLGNKRVKYVGSSGEVSICGRRVYLTGANDARAEEKIRGVTLIGAYVDEVSTIPQDVWTMLLSRLSLEGARLIGTTNPDSPTHWLKTDYLDKCEELNIARFQFRLPDNPHLPESYVKALMGELTGLWRRRMIDGEWCVAAGAIYDCFDPVRHVRSVSQMPAISRLLATGMDYGTTNATAGLLIGITNEPRPRLAVVDEWHPEHGMTDANLSAAYRNWIGHRRPEWVALDPSAASLQQQFFEDGLNNVMNANNEVNGGIRLIHSLLAADLLVIADSCVELIKELPSYVWNPKATEKGKDEPTKINDHFCDALRYGIASTHVLWGNLIPLTIQIDLQEDA